MRGAKQWSKAAWQLCLGRHLEKILLPQNILSWISKTFFLLNSQIDVCLPVRTVCSRLIPICHVCTRTQSWCNVSSIKSLFRLLWLCFAATLALQPLSCHSSALSGRVPLHSVVRSPLGIHCLSLCICLCLDFCLCLCPAWAHCIVYLSIVSLFQTVLHPLQMSLHNTNCTNVIRLCAPIVSLPDHDFGLWHWFQQYPAGPPFTSQNEVSQCWSLPWPVITYY